MRIVNHAGVIADHVVVASSLIGKTVGLMLCRDFRSGSALVLPGCRQIHTFLLRFSIDAIFIDYQNTVVNVVENLQPFRLSPYCREAKATIEVPAGTVSKYNVTIGEILVFDN
jgi:uncharacterized membrane protein (UPF0127 family)